MKLHLYLSHSRHGIFYFRWPLRSVDNHRDRQTILLSLQARCPRQAAALARALAVFGISLGRTGEFGRMRHDELRKAVHTAFKAQLAKMIDGIGADGPISELQQAPLQTSVWLAEGKPDDFREISPWLTNRCPS